jgi:hypothetical protein
VNPNLTNEQALDEYRQKLKRLETAHAVLASKWQKTLSAAADWQKPGIQKQLDEWQQKSDEEIARTKFLIANAEEQIARKTKQARDAARANLDSLKQQALKNWLDEGGSSESFEQSWPEMEKDLLKEKTLSTIDLAG